MPVIEGRVAKTLPHWVALDDHAAGVEGVGPSSALVTGRRAVPHPLSLIIQIISLGPETLSPLG